MRTVVVIEHVEHDQDEETTIIIFKEDKKPGVFKIARRGIPDGSSALDWFNPEVLQ
jgi:hypothetical protein